MRTFVARSVCKVQVTGEFVPNALLVANHVSWLDIPVLGSQVRIDFLSKADIKAWPLIGWMAQIIGTLFIVRGANQTDVPFSSPRSVNVCKGVDTW